MPRLADHIELKVTKNESCRYPRYVKGRNPTLYIPSFCGQTALLLVTIGTNLEEKVVQLMKVYNRKYCTSQREEFVLCLRQE